MSIPSPSQVPPPAPAAEPSAPDGAPPFRVMVVDDSAVIRGLLTRALEADPAIQVVASVGNGQLAINAAGRENLDVVVLDIEMPVMDGLTALPHLLTADPSLKVVVASTLTLRNAEISLRALQAGAADYVAKPTTTREIVGGADLFRRELVEKVKALGAAARRTDPRKAKGQGRDPSRPVTRVPLTVAQRPKPDARPVVLRPNQPSGRPEILAIGSSTGGPQALFEVLKHLSEDITQPIVITQHMPATFTTILAEHIARQCRVACAEAKEGEALRPGRVYVAPGDHHMVLTGSPGAVTLRLTKTPPENFCRPSVDPMLRSVVEIFGGRVMAIILTGMGQDGLKGCETVVKAGGTVVAQDEATSVVWGMPGAVATAGLCSAVLPLAEIGPYVRRVSARQAAA